MNDCVSVKKETNPTLRADAKINSKLKELIIIRIIFFILIIILLLNFINIKNVLIYLFGILLVSFVYAIHNFSKIFKIRYITFPLLRFSHFITPLLIFDINFLIIFFVYFLYYFLYDEISYLNRNNAYPDNKIFFLKFISIVFFTILFHCLMELSRCPFILKNVEILIILRNVGIYLICINLPIIFKKLIVKFSKN